MRRVIGLDFDDVLMDFRYSLDQYHNLQYGTDIKREDAITHDLWEVWNCSKEEYPQRVVDFYYHNYHDEAPPVQGGPGVVRELSKENSLVVITSRPDFIKERTLTWLGRHYGDIFDRVYFSNLFQGSGTVKKKSEVCAELSVDIFVDDFIGYATDVAENGRQVLLLDKPWNQGELHPNITRVDSWNHILQVLS